LPRTPKTAPDFSGDAQLNKRLRELLAAFVSTIGTVQP